MIQFIVNNIELVLPEELSITVIDENPVITRNGEFSHDITISLLVPQNAIAFGIPQRLNNTTIVKAVPAVMIDNLRAINGKAVVLPKSSDSSLTFQFVAGNSELNYLSKEVRKIWELDFGTETTIDFARAMFTLQNPGYGPVMVGEVQTGFNKFCCVPVKYSNLIANNYHIGIWWPSVPAVIESVDNIQMQPYLMHYIENLPELLGYPLEYNALTDDQLANQLFITSKVNSLKYSDALPDISIGEFVSAIEQLFNVFFYISENKKCYILNVESHINGKSIVDLKNVSDSFERDIKDNESDITSIAYELSKDGYHKYQKLDPEVIRLSQKIDYATNYHMKTYVNQTQFNKLIIHRTINNDRQYILTPSPALNTYRIFIPNTDGACNYVNKFKQYGDSNNPTVLSISPLAYTYDETEFTLYEEVGGQRVVACPYQLPLENYTLYTAGAQLMLSAVESSVETLPRKSKIEVGIFSGMVNLYDIEIDFPISYVDNMPEFFMPAELVNNPDKINFETSFNDWIANKYQQVCTLTLRLTGADGIYQRYIKNPKYDNTIEYIFIIPEQLALSTSNLFRHQHQIYIPIRFEKVKNKQKNNLVTGYFYRMKN